MAEPKHNPVVRTCIIITTPPLPPSLLRDDIRCEACDEGHRLMHLDPDVPEVLTREPWCEACLAGDKPQMSQADYDAWSEARRHGGTSQGVRP